MTISKAYSLLEREGVLERRRGQTLVVAERSSAAAATDKLAHLRDHLAAAATMAAQLGISRPQALKLFRETLEATKPTP
jgi:GntR family transcriptional regulator